MAAEEQLANIGRFFDLIRNQSALLADDRAVFLARHLATLIEAGDDPATADPDPDVDAVHVMTVHKAKGLEFPVVFLPGLVADRFPARSRREPLALPLELVDEVLPEGDGHLQEERRLFYVAMTRARDELILSHASESAGGRARRLSPFVIEALDLPTAGFAGTLPTAVHAAGPLERIAAAEGPVEAPEAERTPIGGPLSLSHSAIDDYLTCPLRYKYAQVVRVPTTPHHSMIYGAALHKAVQEFHRSQARGAPLGETELLGVFDGGLDQRRLRVARARDGPPRGRQGRAAPVPRRPASSRAWSCRRGSSASSRSRSAATGSAAGSIGWTSCRSPRHRAP